MATCDELRELLAAYADGELDETTRARVRAHLVGCPDCRRDLAGLERVDAMFRAAAVPEPAEAAWDRVSAALDRTLAASSPAPVRRERRGVFGWWLVPAGALAAAAILMAVFLMAPKPVPPDQVTDLEVGPNYDWKLDLPAKSGDFLIIDVTNRE